MRVIFLQEWGKYKKGDTDFVERNLGRRLVVKDVVRPYVPEIVTPKKETKKKPKQKRKIEIETATTL